ncbi:hypothetical protein [Mycobacterium sp. DL99]|uniref:hypothetical protein n=1 Tax=Mycobacterium sp. DL99 TaxID=2528957 RepID=UPI001AEC05C6|nr:hypothetical protein [Mycobacterium sp. DL99]
MPVASGNRANPAPLVDIARHCVIPDDIAFTRYHELIAPELPGMGVTLDQWQEDIWYAALGVRDDEDRTLACDVMGVTLSIARQAGKTWGIMAGLIAICLSRPGTLVIWSSHHDRTSSETLTKIAGIVEKPAIRPKMRAQHPVVQADDNRGVHFANGSRILFGARSAGFGRGFAEVDIQVYDECQNLKESALTDMLAAMNVSDIGLAFFMGTPPRPQDVALGVHEAFKRRRDKALAPLKKRPFKGIYVEFSPESPDGVVPDIDAPGFWEKLSEANPSYRFRVGNSAIERLVENMSPEDVLREVRHLGQNQRDARGCPEGVLEHSRRGSGRLAGCGVLRHQCHTLGLVLDHRMLVRGRVRARRNRTWHTVGGGGNELYVPPRHQKNSDQARCDWRGQSTGREAQTALFQGVCLHPERGRRRQRLVARHG